MSRYKAYPEYKDSGIEWLGLIPATWELKPLKFMAKIRNGQDYKVVEVDEGYPVIGSGGQFTYASTYTYAKESVLLGRKGTIDKPLYINEPFWTVDTMYYTEINEDIYPKFLYYLAITIQFARYSTNTALPSMTQEHLGNYRFAIPVESNERKKIANFLDHETAKIDTLIAKQQELIKLLKEKRQAVISHAVTKGLNPNAPMRDSGVEWLGEVPAHWEIQKFKHMFEIRKRIAGELGYDVLSITQKGIKIKDIESGDGQLSMDYSKYQIVEKGDFAMNHMDLLTGFVDISMFDGVTSPDYRVFALSDENSVPEYFLCYLRMGYLNRIFFPFGQGAATIGRWRLPTEAFNEFPAPKPPKDEQRQISEFIQRTIAHMELVEEKATFAIQVMKERRTALISAAVTGKIDVRDWQPPSESAIAA